MGKELNWLITRVFDSNKPEDPGIITILTTNGNILARHSKKAIFAAGGKIKGVRRYRTQGAANRKASQLNRDFNTNGYSTIREDCINE